MSSFLGPIHFWLYDKIKLQEELTLHFYNAAVKNNWLEEGDAEASALVKKDLCPLEDLIDTMNIHGWLQECIHDAEGRYARLITMLAGTAPVAELEKIAFDFGKFHAVGKVPVRDAYKIFDDTFLNGMPCDRVNVITQQDDSCFSWEQTQDIHGEYWLNAGGYPETYYKLRKQVMLGMLNGSGLLLENPDYLHYAIKKED
ncbi:MAG: hypothetical protein IIX56_00695 [Treponema sp.]|nr:hypothetical protein [Treponema sp.]